MLHRLFLQRSPFRVFWWGESVSWVGTQVTVVALPLTAIGVAGASTEQVAMLAAVGMTAMVVMTPFTGRWLDSRPVLPVIIGTNVLRAFVLLSVPLVHVLSTVTMPLLYFVAAVAGTLRAVFDIAVLTAVPRLVCEDQLLAANARVMASISVADTAGPAIGGVLVHLITAPFAILADIGSYVLSVIVLARIPRCERVPATPAETGSVLAGAWFGIRYCFGDSRIRPLLLADSWFNIFDKFIMAIFMVYAVRSLALSAAVVGVLLTMAGLGAIAGVAVAAALGTRCSPVAAMVASYWTAAIALAVAPIPTGPGARFVLGATFFAYGCALAVLNVHAIAYRQAIVPDNLHGRVNAGYRTFSFGAMPLGAALGAWMSSLLGARAAMGCAAAALVLGAALLGCIWFVRTTDSLAAQVIA